MTENDIIDFENHMKSMPHTRKKLCYNDNGKFIVLHDDYQSTLLYFLQLRGKIPSIEILFSQYFQQETGIRIKKDDTKKSGYEIVGYEPKLFFNEPSYTELVQALVENE